MNYVLYHGGCWDGLTAAWAAWKYFADQAIYIPVNYGQPVVDLDPGDVYIVDFCYKANEMQELIAKHNKVVLIDHHKTTEERLQHFKATQTVFNTNKSGGRLTWEYFFPHKTAPEIVLYTEDRDLWRWALPFSREINAYIRTCEYSIHSFDVLSQTYLPSHIKEGEAILKREEQIIQQHVDRATLHNINGYFVLAVNATVLFSEIAGELAEYDVFGACYFIRKDGKVQWSLRSRKENGLDVSVIATNLGGGGHPQAAGFEEDYLYQKVSRETTN